jgi:hypothetical protein
MVPRAIDCGHERPHEQPAPRKPAAAPDVPDTQAKEVSA